MHWPIASHRRSLIVVYACANCQPHRHLCPADKIGELRLRHGQLHEVVIGGGGRGGMPVEVLDELLACS
jgi:hypothetical protein